MRYIADVITAVRQRTNNEDFTVDPTGLVTSGIGDDLILEFLNDGQQHLQSSIIAVYPQEFTADTAIQMINGTEEYSLPETIFINNKILHVQYSHSGRTEDYENLPQRTLNDRITSTSNHPSFYIRRSGNLLFNPIPTTSIGKARVTYYRALDRLDTRRGQVASRTLSSTQLTALTLDTSSDDPVKLATATHICVCDADGIVKMYNIPISSYDSGTGVVTITNGAYTFGDGETVSVGDYVTVGKYTTTHSKLPSDCERFLKLYAQVRVLEKDSSIDAADERMQLDKMGAEIITNFSNITEDVEEIPVLDYDIMY